MIYRRQLVFKWLSFLAAIILMCGSATAQVLTSSPDGLVQAESIKVMSYNTYYVFDHGEQIEAGKRWVRSMRPDVVALQELTNIKAETLQGLAEGWGHEYSSLLKTRGFSVGLTSRWPIDDIEKRLDGMHHGFLHAKSNGIHFFVVHLSPFLWEKRSQEAQIIVSRVKPLLQAQESVVVLGDFNAHSPDDAAWLGRDARLMDKMRASDENNDHVQNLDNGQIDYSLIEVFLGTGLVDSAKGQVPDTQAARTSFPTGIFGDKKTSVVTGQRIDYILLSPDLAKRLEETEIIKQGAVNLISDHYPVVAKLSASVNEDKRE